MNTKLGAIRPNRRAEQPGPGSQSLASVPPQNSARATQSEHALQQQVAQYLDRALPADAFWTSIDSAGRGARDGARMKRRGVRKGVPDCLILWGFTVWIELKSAAGRLTPEQKTFRDCAVQSGHTYLVCRSVAEVEQRLREHEIPLRCRVSA